MALFRKSVNIQADIESEMNSDSPHSGAVIDAPALGQKEALGRARGLVEQELSRGMGLSVIDFINALLLLARLSRASDVHFDPQQHKLIIRFRVDGVMQEAYVIPKDNAAEIISRIKILAALRTDEHQSAQDGRFRVEDKLGYMDVRVSIVPTYFGENAVLRLLADGAQHFTLESLGFSEHNRSKIRHAMSRPYGMILATGPTGSGKTTTLYTITKMLNEPDVSIVTIEDPIEYAVPGVNQIQVNGRTGLTFANGLRSILRQDPNIIMVGEIRDAETAGIAVNTALTGHLLLSTLHTNDAATTLPRLLDLKVESYLIASTVNIAIGQRLVRKLCNTCKQGYAPGAIESDHIAKYMGGAVPIKSPALFRAVGCEDCNMSGFLGRIGIHEVMVVDAVVREALLRKATASELKDLAIRQGMTSMLADGMAKVLSGLTTVEEVLRTLYD